MAAIRNITATRIAAGFLAALLLGLGLAYLPSQLALLSGQPVLNAIKDERPVTLTDLARLESALVGAAGLGLATTGLDATATLARATHPETPAVQGQPLLKQAQSLRAASLAQMPADSFGWLSLSWLRLLQGDGAGAWTAWRLSIVAEVYQPDLLLRRVTMALALRDNWGSDGEALVGRQIAYAWHNTPTATVAAARAAGWLELLRDQLRDRPDDLLRLEALLSSLARPAAS